MCRKKEGEDNDEMLKDRSIRLEEKNIVLSIVCDFQNLNNTFCCEGRNTQ